MKLRSIIVKSATTIAMALVAFVCFMTNLNTEDINRSNIPVSNTSAYKTGLSEIASTSWNNNARIISIHDFYNVDSDDMFSSIKSELPSVTDATIITIQNGRELHAFSQLCKVNTNFLGYHYELYSNIDFTEATRYKGSFYPIGTTTNNFTGSFNGNGYEITSLKLYSYSSEEVISSNSYSSMFAYNAGTLENFGLINTSISQTVKPDKIVGVAPVSGSNTGTVQNVYVIDNRRADDASGGIAASGGYSIAGFVYDNKGTIKDCYTSYSILVCYSVQDYFDFREICNENTGTIENVYFQDDCITSYDEQTKTYVYNDALVGVSIDGNKVKVYGEYVSSLGALNLQFDSKTGWYTANTYPSNKMKIKYPSRNGLAMYKGDENTLLIQNEFDFVKMFELMNKDPYFASKSMTYLLLNDIDLKNIPTYLYSYNDFFSATFTGETYAGSLTLKNGSKVKTPTIYNATIKNSVAHDGFDCYGVFPLLSGTISNVNFYNTTTISDFALGTKALTKSIGIVSGYVEDGTIQNVNVYSKIELSTSSTSDSKFGRYIAGMAVGIAGRFSNISKLTTSGEINGATHVYDTNIFANAASGYEQGNSLGGVIGYSLQTNRRMSNLLSGTNLIATSYSSDVSINQMLGGIVGSGYATSFSELTNKGNITIGSDGNANNAKISAAGIIGRLYGVNDEIRSIHSQGTISLTVNAVKETYISGVANVDLKIDVSASTLLKSISTEFSVSGVTNSTKILVTNNISSNTAPSINTAGMFYINSSNEFTSNLRNIYNLNYQYNDSNNYTSDKITSEIDMASIKEFAPIFVSNAESSNGKISAQSCYNLRDYNYVTSKASYITEGRYSGCLSGEYVSLNDCRNEGNMVFNITQSVSLLKNLYIYGIFETLSDKCYANILYNGGNIDIDYNNIKLADSSKIYVSGICINNNSEINLDTQNPLNSSFDNSLVGSIDNVINKGNIHITSKNMKKDLSTNNPNNDDLTLTSSIYASGITYSNSGIISNSFNLGEIVIEAFSKKTGTEYEIGGIACKSTGQYAQIRDSANNGTLKAVNMSNTSATMDVGGIVATNVGNNKNINEIIAFTINYGTVICFNGTANMKSPSYNGSHAMASGIIASGICNAVNVVNYGTIYSSEVAGSLIGRVQLSKFENVNVSLANTINYGKVFALEKHHFDQATIHYPTHAEVDELKYYTYGEYNSSRNVYQYCGSMVGLIDFDSRNNFNIRYLINFFNGSNISGNELNVPTDAVDTATFITTNGSTDTFGKGSVKYAPLSTISDELGNIGVFSKEFVFRKAIDGIGINNSIVTDSYIADFFQFIRFDKINERLLDSIGWRTLAYVNASEVFARNILNVKVLIEKTGSVVNSDGILADEFTKGTWIESVDLSLLEDFIEESLNTNELSDDLKSILTYIFFEQTNTSLISSTVRQNVIDAIINYYDENNSNYYALLQTLLYDELLAKVVAEDDSNYSIILQKIDDILSSATDLRDVLVNYVSVLENDITLLDPLYEEFGDYYINKKMDVINKLISGLSDDVVERMLSMISSSESDSLKYSTYLKDNPSDAKAIFTLLVQYNNVENNIYREAINKSLKKYETTEIIKTTDSFTLIDNYDENSGSTYINGESIAFSKDYTELWNIVKNDASLQEYISTNYFKNVTDPTSSIIYKGLIAKATEYNNTYQSQDSPSGTTNGINNSDGVTRTKNAGEKIRNRYVYTPDSVANEGTYYYGPFMANGTVFGDIISNRNTYLGRDIYNAALITSTQKNYVPMFISTNENITREKLLASNTTATNKNYYPFYWNNYGGGGDPHNQWVSDYILDNAPSDGGRYIFKNYNNGTYIVDYYDFSPNTYYTTNQLASAPNTTITYNGSNVTLSLQTTNNQTYANLDGSGTQNHPLRDYYLKSYCTTSMITGLWNILDIWKDDKKNTIVGCYLTSKGEDNINGYKGVQTTQYTYYQMNDLVKLDGIRTKGLSNNCVDDDEIDIISSLLTKILSTIDGQKVVLKALSKYASKTDFSSSQNASASLLLSALNGTTFAQNSVQSVFSFLTEDELNSLYTFKDQSSSKTLKQHLEDLIINKGYTPTPKQNLAMIASTDKEVFRNILLMLLKPLSNENGTNETNSNDLAYFVYEYSKYLKSQGKEDSEILSLINSIKESDITAFEKLSELDFSYVLGVQDIIEMSSGTDYIFYKIDVNHTGVISVNGDESSDHRDNQYTSSWIIPANTAINIGGTGEVIDCKLYGVNSITTGTSSMYYLLELTFSNGNITINGNRQLAAENESITARWVLECNKTYPITTTNKPSITNVNMYEKNIIELDADTIVQVKYSGTVTINGISHTNSSSAEHSWKLEAGSYPVTVASGTTIEYLFYPTIYHLPQVTYRMGSASGTGSNVSFESGTEQILPIAASQTYTRDSNAVYTYGSLSFSNVPSGAKIGLTLESNKNFNITTTTSFGNGVTGKSATIDSYSGESWLFRGSSDGRTLSQIKLVYTLPYGTDTITYTQYLFSSSNNNSTSIAGSPSNIASYILDDASTQDISNNSLSITGLSNKNHTCVFICSSGTNVSPADLDVSTTPIEANIFTKVDITSMTQVADLSTIEENYNNYYPSLSQYGNYIASNLIKVTTGNTITIEEPSIVFVHATGSGSITLDNYTRTTNAASYYYAFYIRVPGTYPITYSSTTIGEILIVNLDSGLSVSEDLTSIIYNDGIKNETVFKGINYNYLTSYKFTNLIPDSTIKDLALLLFPAIKNSKSEYSIFANDAFTSDNLKELIKLFASADCSDKNNSVFAKLLKEYNGNVSDILLSIENDELKRIIAEKIFSISNNDKVKYSDVYSLAVSTYIGNDYLTYANLNQLTKTKIYKILELYDPEGENPQGYYKYITSDTSIDSDLFLELMTHLELTANIDGYGIYAMSSSAGILNGQFVPDNINLSIYDPYYEKNASGQYILSDEKSDSWRGGTSTVDGVSMPNTPDGSVNKAFYVEMKQLKKSIATSIFKLELISTDESNTIITTPSSEIDLKGKNVDFYLPKNGDGTDLTYKINTTAGSYELSYAATFFNDGDSLNKYDSNTLTVTEGSPNAETTITVYAEDRTVYAVYTVSLHLTSDIALDLTSVEVNGETSVTASGPTVDGNTKLWDATGEYVNAVGGRLTLSFNTTNLPDGFNLDPYITIDGETNYHEPITSSIVVNNNTFTNGVWGSGTALVDLLISNSLSKGEHTLQIQLGSKIIYQVKFKKAAATGTTISNVTMVDYTGKIVNVTFTNRVANTLIKYGKGYTLDDLITKDSNGKPNYLTTFTVSDNATVKISASYEINANELMVYTVTYTITPEEGNEVTYTHILTERDPFLDAKTDDKFVSDSEKISNYVSVIRDGAVMNVNTDSGFKLDSTGSGALSMGYAREDKDGNQLTPRYRFNYKFDGFEYLDDISTYLSVKETEGQKTDSNGNDLYTIDLRYYGMLIMFNAEALPIEYTFNLVYEKTINWTGQESYTRSYTFPKIKISKTKSSYAFLDRIRFIVGLATMSDLATATSLEEIKVGNYEGLKNGEGNNTAKDFVASESILYYNTDKAKSSEHYYIVGALSGEELSSYAPKFTIKSYSKIYQYIEINNEKYVYISLVNGETNEEELFLKDEKDNIYRKDIITSTSNITPIGTLNNNKITINSVDYTVSQYFGTDDSNNKSLVMDYIGNPEEGCFWYVNYMVVAEDEKTIKNYHVAVIDLTNNIKFNFEIIDDTGALNSNSLYVSVVGYTAYYGKKTGQTSSSYYLFDEKGEYTPDDNKISDDSKMVINKAISGWVTKQDDGSYKFIDDHYNVESYGIQAMPYSYFYFYIDLPDGYAVKYQIEAERYDSNIQWGDNSFLPKQTIVTQKVSVKMTIVKSDAAKFPWGQKVLAVLNQKATFDSVLTEEK